MGVKASMPLLCAGFCQIALIKRLLKKENIMQILQKQNSYFLEGNYKRIGDICVEKKILNSEQVESVLETQKSLSHLENDLKCYSQ